ncbi:autotransporter outer membrane beta-barrel domain-containing protein [Alloalcanivorax profundimaris]|uniref:autotransporter outer membrane beta-barrel domain-containing protein n=1 Tax=Alloalcanivorax profundimaris TaxID=2735259 RepID=UPI0018890848|nr:autotransporter outer membrane beta-barrel domain-containing protein [Alloalcanivorax profundimaris]MBF1802291.1 autotransporter domain-containing protein [Alloalcanivorax profundimaris]
MALLPAMASAVSGMPGADGTGSDGVRGGAGGDGGGAVINADASLIIGAGTVHDGGTGGQGHSLDGYSEAAETAAYGLDGTAPLAGQKGIVPGDSFSITIDGVTATIVIEATDTPRDIADKISGAFASGLISVYATQRGAADYLSIGQTSYLYNIEMSNTNNTPLHALGLLDWKLARPFDDGGHGGMGGHGVVRQGVGLGTHNAGELYGGDGGEGGFSDYYLAGEGGNGGDGGDAFRNMDGGGTLTNDAGGYIQGGNGGEGGAGSTYDYPAAGGAGGKGGTGVRMSGATLINRGDILGGDGGLGESGGDGGAAGDAVWIDNAATVRQFSGGLYGGWGGDSVGSGGDGADGGAGLRLTGGGSVEILGGEVVGGRGGDGAQSGDGGAGIVMDGGDLLIASGAEVQGGGSGFVGFGMVAEGGVGVSGADLDVTLGGTVSGGTRSNGSNRAAAIHFTGGANRLTLLSGFQQSGGVRAEGGNDVLALGGADDGVFDLGDIGTAFQGFEAFAKRGVGTWRLTGNGAQDWLIEGGTLAGNSDALGGNVTNQGVLRFEQSLDGVYAGTISGAGVLEKTGAGVLTLSGANGHAGGTLVREGGLSVASDGALGSGALGLDGGTLIVTGTGFSATARQLQLGVGGGTLAVTDAGHALTWDGRLLGAGAFEKSGAGDLVLTGANAFSGGLTVSGGTLTGASASLGSGDIVNNATLVIDQTAAAVLNNDFSGTGALRKSGAGWLALNGDGAAFTGATRVGQGGLAVNGDWHGSAMTVADGATLGGTGTVGATVVETGGTLAAGNSIGTLAVDGDLTLNSGATLAVEVDPSGGDGDRILVAGQARLAGSVIHVGAGGAYRPLSEYTFLSADGGILGQFDDVSSDYAFLDPSLVYGARDVTLRLARNNVRFASLAGTDNQRAVATHAETLPTGHAVQQHLLPLSGARAPAAFSALSGDSLLAGPTVAMALQRQFADALRQRGGALDGGSRATLNQRLQRGLQALAAPTGSAHRTVAPTGLTPARAAGDGGGERGGVWVQARSSRYQEDADFPTGNAAYTFRGEQLALGVDGRRGDWLLGAAAGRGQGDFHYRNRDADGDLEAWFAGLYGRWQGDGGLYARGDLNYGRARVDHRRSAAAGVLAESDSDLHSLRVDLEAGIDLIQGDVVLRPYGRLAWTRLERDAFTETGAGALGLAVDDTTLGVGEAAVGVDGARYFQIGRQRLSLHGGLALERGFGDAHAEQDAAFVGTGGTFRVAGAERDRLQLAPHLGVGLAVTPALSLWAGYQGRLGGEHHSQGALLSGRLTW